MSSGSVRSGLGPGAPDRDRRPKVPSETPHTHGRSAFTLLEFAIAILIVGALAGLAIPMFTQYQDRANVVRAGIDIHHIEAAIKLEAFEHRRVPDSIAHLPESKILDPWGNPYQYLNVSDSAPTSNKGKARKDKRLVPINSDFDLYSMGKDGSTSAPLTAKTSHDDIIRANDGAYVGLAENY